MANAVDQNPFARAIPASQKNIKKRYAATFAKCFMLFVLWKISIFLATDVLYNIVFFRRLLRPM